MIIDKIVEDIITYKEDKPHIIITDDMIKDLIEEYKQEIIEEIKERVEEYVSN